MRKHEDSSADISHIYCQQGAIVMVRSLGKDHLTEIERAIEAEVRNRPPVHEPNHATTPTVSAPTMAMPDYVEHSAGATEIGKLSAEAVVREYEIAAKEIEVMGMELMDLVKQCETVTRNALGVTEELKETASRYREEAKRVFQQIENCSQVTAEVRNICNDLREKIAARNSTTKTE
jgi:hypothetical protein